MDARTWTGQQVAAVTAAADLVITDAGLGCGEREADLVNLAAHAALTLLEHPGVPLDEVMNTRYEGGAAQVRSWWDGWR